jgi:hypothetical protein
MISSPCWDQPVRDAPAELTNPGGRFLGKSLIKFCNELSYVPKNLISFFNRESSAQTSLDRAAEKPKNTSQQVFPTHYRPFLTERHGPGCVPEPPFATTGYRPPFRAR